MALAGGGLRPNGLGGPRRPLFLPGPGRVVGPFLLQPPKVLGRHPRLLLCDPAPHVCVGLLLPLLQGWGALGMREVRWGGGRGAGRDRKLRRCGGLQSQPLTPSPAPGEKREEI